MLLEKCACVCASMFEGGDNAGHLTGLSIFPLSSCRQAPLTCCYLCLTINRFTLSRIVINASLALQRFLWEESTWMLSLPSHCCHWSMWHFPIASVQRLALQTQQQGILSGFIHLYDSCLILWLDAKCLISILHSSWWGSSIQEYQCSYSTLMSWLIAKSYIHGLATFVILLLITAIQY
jgi:hypothetical protein